MNLISKKSNFLDMILSNMFFAYLSIFYVAFKSTFYNKGKWFTVFMLLYAITIIIYNFAKKALNDKDYVKNRYGLSKNNIIWWISIAIIASSLISAFYRGMLDIHRFATLEAVIGINLLLYLFMYNDIDEEKMKLHFNNICTITMIYIFIFSIVEMYLIFTKSRIDVLGIKWGLYYENGKYLRFRMGTNANMVGWISGIGIGVSINSFFNNKKFIKIVSVINMLMCIFVIMITQSKSCLFGILLYVVIVLSVIAIKKGKIKHLLLMYMCIVGILALLFTFGSSYFSNVRVLQNGSNSERIELIKYGLIVLSNVGFILGSGLGNLPSDWYSLHNYICSNFAFTSKRILDVEDDFFKIANAHNIIFQQLFENGIVGVLLLIILFVIIFYNVMVWLKHLNIEDKEQMKWMLVVLYFVVFCFFVGNLGMNLLFTITQFTSIFFFLAVSMIINNNKKIGKKYESI